MLIFEYTSHAPYYTTIITLLAWAVTKHSSFVFWSRSVNIVAVRAITHASSFLECQVKRLLSGSMVQAVR